MVIHRKELTDVCCFDYPHLVVDIQHLIFELIQRKIDELLGGMCFIEWEASGIKSKPASYVEDVISYLQVHTYLSTYLLRTSFKKIITHWVPYSPFPMGGAAMVIRGATYY